jgi:CBS domain containing-hemolysin-like protein
VGYIHIGDIFNEPSDIKSIIREIIIAPETLPANKLLSEFIQKKKSIALVVDEFGGTAGIVTIEDILEEIFGEIDDEHDTNEFIEKRVNENEYIFSGRLEIDYINEKYHLNIPESQEYETLAGFILYYHHSIPKTNETINIQDYSIKILKSSSTKIDLIQLKKSTND